MKQHRRLIAIVVLLLGWAGSAGAVDIERLRREPILDGEGAAGLKLGDSYEIMVQKLGAPGRTWSPTRQSSLVEHAYVWDGPGQAWQIALSVKFSIGSVGIDIIEVSAMRRGTTGFPYLGRTRLGYAAGDSGARLRNLYGKPDLVLGVHLVDRDWFWYSKAGLIVSPLVKGDDHEVAQLSVLRPNASPDEARRLLFE